MSDVVRSRLDIGLQMLTKRDPDWKLLEGYHRGTHERPFAPEGVNKEYDELREMAVAPWLRLAVRTPVQRLRADGFRTTKHSDSDEDFWNDVWIANSLESRQRILYTDGVVHGRGVCGVWPNPNNRKQPIIRPESPRAVYIQPSGDDPYVSEWAVKAWISSNVNNNDGQPEVDTAIVYDLKEFHRFKREGRNWVLQFSKPNPLKAIPFVEFCPEVDAEGRYHSMIRPLMPMQRAIDTARFDLLLAMQFSAYRQRFVTGYDPVVRDKDGNVMFKSNADGTPILDRNGQPEPLISSPGRPGVDRLMVFPGELTKVFDLPESNLKNYVDVISSLVQHLAAISQVPPQYLLGGLANLSGEALAAAESTLASLVSDMQDSFAGSFAQVARLAGIARGDDAKSIPTEVVWGDGQARPFSQTVDGIQKLVSLGFPLQGGLEMLPGATDQKVRRWMELAKAEADDPILAQILGKEPVNDSAGDDAAVLGAETDNS